MGITIKLTSQAKQTNWVRLTFLLGRIGGGVGIQPYNMSSIKTPGVRLTFQMIFKALLLIATFEFLVENY